MRAGYTASERAPAPAAAGDRWRHRGGDSPGEESDNLIAVFWDAEEGTTAMERCWHVETCGGAVSNARYVATLLPSDRGNVGEPPHVGLGSDKCTLHLSHRQPVVGAHGGGDRGAGGGSGAATRCRADAAGQVLGADRCAE